MAKVTAISGYKPFELGIYKNDHPAVKYIKTAIKRHLLNLLDEGLEWVLISGQLGVECWSAEVVLELQDEYPDLKLAILTPFLEQEEKWSDQNKEYYEMISAQADFYESISRQPYQSPSQFQVKNRLFLHKSDCLIMMYDEQQEGSPKYFLEEARKYKDTIQYDIRIIDFYELQVIMEEDQWNM
ncbi:DUF1273 domain-containing protein [Heyndrickxia acidicola]|uniref:UPF0398 protein P4T90_18505 n=1 Tax=Heyndrickxia acidicola TaxID=209389 RepID=A0ABU6MK27_9BACI|nr:DUF1273 domain-containing protein [Heyndrickxia acidicola]MED1205043.1 DUF1273 domain-containing protein [Heyndrickxia acidicola]